MKITAKGNSAWLVLTDVSCSRPIYVRTRDIVAVETTYDSGNSCFTRIYVPFCITVAESHIDILRALEVNLPTPGSELQTDDITQGS